VASRLRAGIPGACSFRGTFTTTRNCQGTSNGGGLYQPIVVSRAFGLVNAEAMACGTPVVGRTAAGYMSVGGSWNAD